MANSGKNHKIQFVTLSAAFLAGCATGPDSAKNSVVMPNFNAAARQSCEPLTRWDFAFTSSADGDTELYLYDARSAALTKLTDNDVADHWPSFSPDGRMLAYQSQRDGNREVYIQVLGSDSGVNASQHPEQDLLPSWSPNGQYVVWHSSRDVPWDGAGPIGGYLYVMRVQGSAIGRIQTESFYSTSAIAWSPDSSTLFYARYAVGKAGIYAFDIRTGTETALLALEGKYPGIASVNPAEGTVDYFVDQGDDSIIYQLWLMDGTSRRLSPNPGKYYYAAWSPDRSALLVTAAQDSSGQRFDIRCIAADGSYDVAVIDDASDARSAAWRPRGP